MRIRAIFLLLVGCVWAAFVVLMFLTLAGITDGPVSLPSVAFYWGGMLIGPLSLIAGSCLALITGPRRFAAVLVAFGCLILTGYALYNSIAAMHRKPLQAPPPYWFYVVMLIVMLFADLSGFRVVRKLLDSPVPAH
jgi:hypothetical protein